MKLIRTNIWQDDQSSTNGNVKWSFWNDFIPYHNDLICFNTRSGSVLLMTKNDLNITNLCSETIGKLTTAGVLVDNNRDELFEWSAEYRKGKLDKSILDMTILLTQQCQFQCVYCFEGKEKANRVLTDKASEDIVRYIENRANELRVIHITWFGGEPLLGIKRIRQLSPLLLAISNRYDINYYADMTTNGYTLTSDMCKILVDECHVKRYIITIDGTPAVHDKRRPLKNGMGTFDVIWNNLSNLIEHDATVTIRMTIDKGNINNVRDFIDLIAKSNYARKVHIIFTKTFATDSTPSEIKEVIYSDYEFSIIEMELIKYAHDVGLLDYRTPRPTPVGGCLRIGDMAIGTQGELYKCNSTVGNSDWIVGNIGDKESCEIPAWYQSWLEWEPAMRVKCKTCRLQPLCNGGCPHNALFSKKMHGSETPCPDWIVNYKDKVIMFVEDAIKTKIYEEI